MAMTAVHQQEINKPQVPVQGSSILNVSAVKYYQDTLRPACEKAMVECKTDPELERSLRKIENSLDSQLSRQQYTEALDVTLPLFKVITSDSYYITGGLKRASEAEKEKVRELVKLFNDFRLILKVDADNKKEEPAAEPRKRVGYEESNDSRPGHNTDLEHNMENLNKGEGKKRLPNTEYAF